MMASSEAVSAESGIAPHILVVDDDARLRKLLQRYLTESGFLVTTAADAAEARAKMRGLAFDLLVLDVMMPGEDGLSLTQSLRRSTDVPILLLTARGEPQDRIAGLESGADDYLAKPFEPRELTLRIATILRRFKPGRTGSGELRLGRCRFDPERGELKDGDAVIKLTAGETVLLKTLSEQPGATFTRQDLSERLGARRSVRSTSR